MGLQFRADSAGRAASCHGGRERIRPRGQQGAILAGRPHDLTGFYLAVDCLVPRQRCAGVRTFAVAELATTAAVVGEAKAPGSSSFA
jgi:hypothetical protein